MRQQVRTEKEINYNTCCIFFYGFKGLVKKYRGGGWAGAFGNVVDKKHVTHPLPLAQK